MIARTWCGKASIEKADDYQRHFTTRVTPHLKELAGHRGAYLLRREANDGVEFLAVTLWDSMESVKAFAGQDPHVALVEPEGRAALSSFDDFAKHYEVTYYGPDNHHRGPDGFINQRRASASISACIRSLNSSDQ